MTWLGDVLTSRPFWELRIVTAAASIIIIWRVTIMTTDMILYTPTEYLPVLVLVGLIVTGFLTILKGRQAYNDAMKAALREGTITEATGYGMDYLAANIGCIIVGVICAVVLPGMIYAGLDVEADYAGCIVIALVTSIIVGIRGCTTFSDVADIFRDSGKIADLEATAKTESK